MKNSDKKKLTKILKYISRKNIMPTINISLKSIAALPAPYEISVSNITIAYPFTAVAQFKCVKSFIVGEQPIYCHARCKL